MKQAKLTKAIVISCPYCSYFFGWDDEKYKFSPNIECQKCKQYFTINNNKFNEKLKELK